MLKMISTLFAATLFVTTAVACPNPSNTVTIPISGSTLYTLYDQSCNVLPGGSISLQQQTPTLSNWNAGTSPGYTGDASGIHLSANGAPAGTAGTVRLMYVNGLSLTINYVVGAPVTSVSGGTSTP